MNEKRSHKSASQVRREGDKKLLVMVILTLIVVGGGLILLLYGGWGLAASLPVLFFGAFLIFVPYLVLLGLQKWRDRMEEKGWQEAEEWTAKHKEEKEKIG